ncbi:sigma-70 family RNA polymerase sigma factor [Marinilabiliaceae bacterium JC017]|nr:sigma-70 family RNA polymerase sigma factor [Marinilabiliaceae bacterium JC017]
MNQENQSDETLLLRYKETGDIDLLGFLYNRYLHLVYGVCLKYFKNRDTAQDAVMTIFEKLVTELLDKEVERFKPWLYVVTKNYCLMELRHQQTLRKKEKEWLDSSQLFMENEMELHPIDRTTPDAMEQKLQECLKKLKQEQRQCIELFYFDNKCYNEISALLTLDPKKVKSYIQNGKRNLKICLES